MKILESTGDVYYTSHALCDIKPTVSNQSQLLLMTQVMYSGSEAGTQTDKLQSGRQTDLNRQSDRQTDGHFTSPTIIFIAVISSA